eukprot:364973-Chlamydomonas_euryale.AAC.17
MAPSSYLLAWDRKNLAPLNLSKTNASPSGNTHLQQPTPSPSGNTHLQQPTPSPPLDSFFRPSPLDSFFRPVLADGAAFGAKKLGGGQEETYLEGARLALVWTRFKERYVLIVQLLRQRAQIAHAVLKAHGRRGRERPRTPPAAQKPARPSQLRRCSTAAAVAQNNPRQHGVGRGAGMRSSAEKVDQRCQCQDSGDPEQKRQCWPASGRAPLWLLLLLSHPHCTAGVCLRSHVVMLCAGARVRGRAPKPMLPVLLPSPRAAAGAAAVAACCSAAVWLAAVHSRQCP